MYEKVYSEQTLKDLEDSYKFFQEHEWERGGWFFLTKEGKEARTTREVHSCCMLGAVWACILKDSYRLTPALASPIERRRYGSVVDLLRKSAELLYLQDDSRFFTSFGRLDDFNDTYANNKEEIEKIYEKAIEILKQQQESTND